MGSQDCIRPALVRVQGKRRDLGRVLEEALDELLLVGQAFAVCDDGQEHFIGLPGAAHDSMPKDAASAVFVVGRDVHALCGLRN